MAACALSVVIPARDAAATLGATLDGLTRQRLDGGVEVVVVDNGSIDDTAALAAAAGVRVIRRERGEGPGPARNEGVRAARGEALAFLDADCVPAPGWAAAGLACLSEAALVQGRVAPTPGVAVGPFDRTLWVDRLSGRFESANLFVSREAFATADGFACGLEGPGQAPFGEDALFGWRVLRAGLAARYCAEALVHHHVFVRGPGAYLRERRRLALFPALVRHAPELRETMLYRRFFLSPRSARLNLALAGVLAGVCGRPWAAAAAAPYLVALGRESFAHGRRQETSAIPVLLAGDLLGAAALVAGSVRARTPVL